MASPDEIAAFLKKGGTINRVPANARVTTEREMYQRIRGINENVEDVDPSYAELEHRAEREREIFADARYNGASREQAWDEAQDWRARRHDRLNGRG